MWFSVCVPVCALIHLCLQHIVTAENLNVTQMGEGMASAAITQANADITDVTSVMQVINPADTTSSPAEVLLSQRCNKTSIYTYKTDCLSCYLNEHVSCRAGSIKKTSGQGLEDCEYMVTMQDNVAPILLSGCLHVCEMEVVDEWCCRGYWGQDCQGNSLKLCWKKQAFSVYFSNSFEYIVSLGLW